jgi:hypothetical protein
MKSLFLNDINVKVHNAKNLKKKAVSIVFKIRQKIRKKKQTIEYKHDKQCFYEIGN